MIARTRYYPPNINRDWLADEVLNCYPSHQQCPVLIVKLVDEYIKLWRLFLQYPEKRIVAPGPIIAVQEVHKLNRRIYFQHCMEYFRRFLNKEFVWGGRSDVQGTIDTVRSYIDLYNEQPPEQWVDITTEYNLGRSHLRLVRTPR